MGDLLEFPSTQAQGLAFLERELRHSLQARNADTSVINFACQQLLSVYEQSCKAENYQLDITLPADLTSEQSEQLQSQLSSAMETIRSHNHAVIVKLIAELVLTQTSLFEQLQQDTKAPTPPE